MDSKWRLPDEDKDFEDLCCLIAQEKYRDPDAQKYGRRGQKQFGVDILTVDRTHTPPQKVAIQCKFKEDPHLFSVTKAKNEIQKELEAAFKGQQTFGKFVYASNIKNDTHLQDFADELAQEHGIDVVVWSDADIKLAIDASDKLSKIYTVGQSITENHFHQYGEVKIQQKLNTSPVNPSVFIGRDDELGEIYNDLHQTDNLLLLVNGEGGIGKTTLASAYYHRYGHHYQHLAWVYADDGIADALLTLEYSLKIKPDPQMDRDQRLQHLLDELANLKPNCLLIVDNANALDELENNYAALGRLSNFHILITSRVSEFADVRRHAVGQLSEGDAKTLFCRHYPGHDSNEDGLLTAVFVAVGYNTLVIELLAKNLKKLNLFNTRYSLGQLLKDLDDKGLTQLSQTKSVETVYGSQGHGLRKEKPESVIAAMYQTAELSEVEQQLIAVFSVLPAAPIEYRHVETLLIEFEELDDSLDALRQLGWLDFNGEDKTFKCSPVVQQVVRGQSVDYGYQLLLIDQLIHLLDYEKDTGHLPNSEYQDAALYAHFAEYFLKWVVKPSYGTSVLFERTGRYNETIGDLNKPLVFYQIFSQTTNELLKRDPKNQEYKNDLAISYEKQGDIYSAKGDLDRALEYYLKNAKLSKQLHLGYPKNIEFKNGLAICYSKLGNINSTKGDLEQALGFYELYAELQGQLLQDNPQNIEFKNGLGISYSKLGDTYSTINDLEKALEFYEQFSTLFEQLNKSYPQHSGFKNGLSVSYSKIGKTFSAKGDYDKAFRCCAKFAGLQKQLHQDYPQHIGFKNGLAMSLTHLGANDLIQGNNKPRAKGYFEQAQKIWQEINRDCPGYAEYQRSLEGVTTILAIWKINNQPKN
ncbi:MAG: tetratricopeptide repeat protein [Algicola sp.]|nr:tetratricopeptide repeat protein [Algicola sp.]